VDECKPLPAGPRLGPHAAAPAFSVVRVAAHVHVSRVSEPSTAVPATPLVHPTQCPPWRKERTAPAAHPVAGAYNRPLLGSK